jgi:hypothetical protein
MMIDTIDIDRLADEIVKSLFTNGDGWEAERLVLELPSGRDGGGWCPSAVRELIVAVVRQALEVGDDQDRSGG